MDRAGLIGFDVAEHDVGSAHDQLSRMRNSFHRFDPAVDSLQKTADGAGTVRARLIGGDHRRRFGDTIALDQLDVVLVAHQRARFVAQPLRAADGEPQAAQIAHIAGARILRDECVG